jgi:chaperonin GroEL
MSKDFLFGQEARDKILKGVNIVSKAVCATLGPKGRTILIHQGNSYRSTKDGVSVAKASLPLKDQFEDIGARAIAEAS